MAYTNSPNDRELRFRSQHDSSLLVSPPRTNGRFPPPVQNNQDGRGGSVLTRRFTTDSGRVPTIASIANQRAGQQDSQDFGAYHSSKVQLVSNSFLLECPTICDLPEL
ncbi:hypothetical protein BDZ45DRAFT_35639 [Acephala macrosclerotiorum]|nr:hypothetical protein BDZ45DRAFT_35639 [Acephala macrosclerotiorum]